MRSAFFFPPGLCSEVHVKNKRRGIKLNIFYVTNVELVLPKYNSGNTRAGGCSNVSTRVVQRYPVLDTTTWAVKKHCF